MVCLQQLYREVLLMKHLTFVSASVLIFGTVCMVSATSPTPTTHSSQGGTNQPKTFSQAAPKPNLHQINTRLRAQWKLIQQGVKSGKVTKDQASALRSDLKSVRQQEVGFIKQDGKQDLTTDQVSQLSALLDKNSTTLGESSSTKN